MALSMSPIPLLYSLYSLLTIFQDIAPTYYDINSFPKGDIRSALTRAADRLARKEKMRAEKHR
jgi:hypothetical protein